MNNHYNTIDSYNKHFGHIKIILNNPPHGSVTVESHTHVDIICFT
jgi:hypothetical protein